MSQEDWLGEVFKKAEDALDQLPDWALPVVVTKPNIDTRIFSHRRDPNFYDPRRSDGDERPPKAR